VLDSLHLHAEPVAVHEVVEERVHVAFDALRAAPVVELPIGLHARQEATQVLVGGHGQVAAVAVCSLSVTRREVGPEARTCPLRHGARLWQRQRPVRAAGGAGYDPRLMRSKDDVREDIWRAMDREGVSRFPGAEGRIPNFAGAKAAADRLSRHPHWVRAETIKANPDSPQTHARRLALAQGKLVVMAVPRLRDEHPFRLLDPSKLSEDAIR